MKAAAAGLPLAALVVAAGPAAGQVGVELPSGQTVTLVDIVHDAPGAAGRTARFRFLAPQIARDGGSVDAETAFGDMQALCEEYALPRLPATGPVPAQIVITLMDREVAFGQPAPEATQFFEAFRPEGTTCIWEPF